MSKKLKKNIILQKGCPLCFEKKFTKKIGNNKNVYSYLFSEVLQLKESFLLKELFNVECSNCGLIYKKKWVTSNVKNTIYKKKIPIHPTGNDVLKNKFSFKFFNEKINNFDLSIKNKNVVETEKLKREIISLLNAVENKTNKFKTSKKNFLLQLKKNNFDFLQKNKKYFKKKFIKARDYSRFKGYGNDIIWNFLSRNIPTITNYAEIGCPAWGMMREAKKKGKNIIFISHKNNNFWNCSTYSSNKNLLNQNCLKLSKRRYDFKHFKNLDKIKNKVCYIGIYNYLDHIEKPFSFFKNLSKKTNSIGLILKLIKNSNTEIQHFTTWNIRSLSYLSKKINYNFTKSNFNLSDTGYKLYLMRAK